MPGSGHGMPFVVSFLAPWILRAIDVSEVEKQKAFQKIINFPAIGILGTKQDTVYDWLQTGEMLEKLLLYLETHGLKASIMVAGIESSNARKQLQKFVDKKINETVPLFPQMFFGFGYPIKNVPHSPRQTLMSFLLP